MENRNHLTGEKWQDIGYGFVLSDSVPVVSYLNDKIFLKVFMAKNLR